MDKRATGLSGQHAGLRDLDRHTRLVSTRQNMISAIEHPTVVGGRVSGIRKNPGSIDRRKPMS